MLAFFEILVRLIRLPEGASQYTQQASRERIHLRIHLHEAAHLKYDAACSTTNKHVGIRDRWHLRVCEVERTSIGYGVNVFPMQDRGEGAVVFSF